MAFALALFGPDAVALAPLAAVLVASLLADVALTNTVELRGKVAVVWRGGDGAHVPFHARARRAQQAGVVAVVTINNEGDTPVAYTDGGGKAGDIAILALCVGRADGERLLLGARPWSPSPTISRRRCCTAGRTRRRRRSAWCGRLAAASRSVDCQTTSLTGALVDGYPAYAAGLTMHVYRHPGFDQWLISPEPFDPEDPAYFAMIPAVGGPVPTGARAWTVVVDDDCEWAIAEVTAREVA